MTRRRRLLCAAFLAGAGTPLAAQTGAWVRQAPIPSANTILTVAPLSGEHVLCSSAPWPFSHNGHVATSTDGGLNWEVMQLDIGGVHCMFFLDDQLGWSVGGAFRHTTDGGQTWTTVRPAGSGPRQWDVEWGDAQTIICSGVASYCSSTAYSTGQAATIGWSGSCVAAVNDFTLVASPLPDQTFLYFSGPNQIQAPFGNGLRCVGGGVTRVRPPGVASGGAAQRQVDLVAFGLTAGTTTRFQCWFRDPAAGGALFDLSDALSATFE